MLQVEIHFCPLSVSQMADEKQLLHTNATALLLRLQAWDDGGCPVAHFTVEYRPLGASRWQLVAAETSEPELQVSSQYIISVSVIFL